MWQKSKGVGLDGLISKNKTKELVLVLKQKKSCKPLSTANSAQYSMYETIKTHALTFLSHFLALTGVNDTTFQ